MGTRVVSSITVAIGELRAQGYLGGRFLLTRDQFPSDFSIKGDCSAGLHFLLQKNSVLPPISIGGSFTGTISVLPFGFERQSDSNPLSEEPVRTPTALTNVCAVAQLSPHADYDGTVNVPISQTEDDIAGRSVSLWDSSGSAHGHLSSRPDDVDRLSPVGGGAFGAYPYSLHYADCSPRPVPGDPREFDPAESPLHLSTSMRNPSTASLIVMCPSHGSDSLNQ